VTMFDNDATPEEVQQRLRAESWRYNPELEEAARLKADRPEIFERLAPTVRISLGFYQADKAAAKALGRDVSERASR